MSETQVTLKAYKVTDKDMKCRGFQFELGKSFKVKGEIVACGNGFHCCKKLADCFGYYAFSDSNRVFEVIVKGEFIEEGDKLCCREIEFIGELNWNEVLDLCNTGDHNTGYRNAGYHNTGYRNTGNHNTGNLNTNEPKTVRVFNKDSGLSRGEFVEKYHYVLSRISPDKTRFIHSSDMAELEKEEFPSHETTGGYLTSLTKKELSDEAQSLYDSLGEKDKKLIQSIPNFNAEMFFEIMGIRVDRGTES